MATELLADGIRAVLFVTFSLAVAEKVSILRSRAAGWHPVLLASRTRRLHATKLLAASLVADVLALALLVLSPGAGAMLSAALIALYSVLGARAHAGSGGQGCRCFWKVLNTSTRTGLLIRNAALLAIAPWVALEPPTAFTPGGVVYGAVLLVMLAILATIADRAARPGRAPVKAAGRI